MNLKFHITDIVWGHLNNWVLTDQGWVEIPRTFKVKDVNKFFNPDTNPVGYPVDGFWVISSKGDKRYHVTQEPYWYCTCRGFEFHHNCSHITNVKKTFL